MFKFLPFLLALNGVHSEFLRNGNIDNSQVITYESKSIRNKVLDSMLEETDVKFNPEWEKEIDFNGPMVAVFETYTTPFNETFVIQFLQQL